MTVTVALLGTGLLGSAIASRLLAVGCSLRIWNRDRARCEPLIASGAQGFDDPAQAIAGASTVITVLRDGPVTSEVVTSLGALNQSCVMPMGTMGISESVALETQVQIRVVFILKPLCWAAVLKRWQAGCWSWQAVIRRCLISSALF